MKRLFFTFLGLLFLFGSCRVPKDVVYFQGVENMTDDQRAATNQKFVSIIRIDDALIIQVTAPDKTSVAPFASTGYYVSGDVEISPTAQNFYTYLVDEEGYITFPVLGRLHVAGKKTIEVSRTLEEMIRKSAPNAIVKIEITNFTVGIFGEVRRPDLYNIRSPRFSVLDLIARAGDLTLYGDRTSIKLIRDNDGEKIIGVIDLTDPAILASPYYYLQQNDVIYVEPNKAMKRSSSVTDRDNVRISIASVIASGMVALVTALLVVFSGQSSSSN